MAKKNEWDYMPTDDEVEANIGFVYMITQNTMRHVKVDAPNRKALTFIGRRFYIGKKQFWNKRGKDWYESDWRDYWGSSKELLNDIKKYGVGDFRREILWLCESKASLNYMELKEQIEYDVYYTPLAYNKIINVRIPCRKGRAGYSFPEERYNEFKDLG